MISRRVMWSCVDSCPPKRGPAHSRTASTGYHLFLYIHSHIGADLLGFPRHHNPLQSLQPSSKSVCGRHNLPRRGSGACHQLRRSPRSTFINYKLCNNNYGVRHCIVSRCIVDLVNVREVQRGHGGLFSEMVTETLSLSGTDK